MSLLSEGIILDDKQRERFDEVELWLCVSLIRRRADEVRGLQ